MKLLVKLALILIIITIYPSCKKEGYTRFLNITCKIEVLPDTSHIRLGDTIKVIAWIPFNSYDNYSRSFVDVKNMEVNIWSLFNFYGLDSTGPVLSPTPLIKGSGIFENYFNRQMVAGDFANYPRNHSIKYLQKNDTCFYFEMKLVPYKKWAYMWRPSSTVGFLNKNTWKVEIPSKILNQKLNHFILEEYMPGADAYNDDYFLKTY